ncbi:phage tail assembly chaperone [Alsobacter metallidurans]
MRAAGRRPDHPDGEPSRPFPWSDAMAFGLGVLRLSPANFWAATPRELAAAAEGVFGKTRGGGAPTGADVRALMRMFPD